MKAVVFHGVGDIRLEEVPDPRIEEPFDAIVRITASAICGTDLHMVRGTLSGMKPGTILGHEGVGVVEEVGDGVRSFRPGDRVIIPSTIGCGTCSYCRAGYFSQCDRANPNGKLAGTAFFGGPESSGPFQGLQAERARIPYAHVGLVKLPDEVLDDEAILLSDIFPTGWFAAELAEIKPGNLVAVFGCGPVGQFAIASARILGAGRIFAIDDVPSRLDMAREQGAEAIDFDAEDPVEALRDLTDGIGPDRAIDAVGVDANLPRKGPALRKLGKEKKAFEEEVREVAPEQHPEGDNWHPGNAPSIVLRWAVDAVAKAGSVSVVGVYGNERRFPIGDAVEKSLTIHVGNCNHRRYIPRLLDLVRSGIVRPSRLVTKVEPLISAIEAYKAFDLRRPGWLKVELRPAGEAAPAA